MKVEVQHNSNTAFVQDVKAIHYSGQIFVSVTAKEKWVDSELFSESSDQTIYEVVFFGASNHRRQMGLTTVRLIPESPAEQELFRNSWSLTVSKRYGHTLVITPRPPDDAEIEVVFQEER